MKIDRKVIWYDITNVPHVNFFYPISKELNEVYDSFFSIRNFAETKNLFIKKFSTKPIEVGVHAGKNKAAKVISAISRLIHLHSKIPEFELKISFGGDASGILSKVS